MKKNDITQSHTHPEKEIKLPVPWNLCVSPQHPVPYPRGSPFLAGVFVVSPVSRGLTYAV